MKNNKHKLQGESNQFPLLFMPITISYKKGDRLLMNKKVPVVTKHESKTWKEWLVYANKIVKYIKENG